MLLKNWDPTRGCFQVTFDLPAGLDVETAAVVGDFNDWSADTHVMERTDDGRLEVQVAFEPGTRARFRYRIDDDRWENDWNADDYVANEFGGEDSLLVVPDAPPSVEPAGDGAAPARKAARKKVAAAKKAAGGKAPAKKKAAAKKPARKAAKKSASRPDESAGGPPAGAP